MEEDNTGPINISNPNEFTMIERAETVKELINLRIEIKMVENTPHNPGRESQTSQMQINCLDGSQ
ncbi:hypothetical protein Ccrd_008792, partial [Cynara cardunculus var. scolymus]